MAKKKELVVEKPNYLELAIAFNSDELLAFYLKKIKEEIGANTQNAYDFREQSAARIAALESDKAKLMRALADLEAASITPMTKSRYDFLESQRTQAHRILAEVK